MAEDNAPFMAEDTLPFLAGGGRMGAEIARVDWAATPLGPIEGWPAALKVAVGMMVNSAFPKCLCWGPELIAVYNAAFVPILGGKHPCLGRPFPEIWSEAWGELGPIVERAMAGEAIFIEDFPLEIHRSQHPEEAFFTFCYSPVRDEDGVIRGMLDTVIETTGKVRAERLGRLRNRELVHRSRNAYALVSAVVRQTFRTADSLGEAQDKIESRLSSLVRAQDVLASSPAAEADVAQIVARALEPFSGESGEIAAAGPPIMIGRDQVTSLALALHELATNAAKYGALSVTGGHVSLTWGLADMDGGRSFRLDWVESGGPPVEPPTRRGFGSRLVEEALAREFDGEAEFAYLPEGLRFSLRGKPRQSR